jgi:hypothetical protein
VPIIWVTQTIQGELLCGVMADWEDLIANVPELARACGSALWVLENRHNKDSVKWDEYARATMEDLRKALKGENRD